MTGVRVAGIPAGIKSNGAPDLAVIVAGEPVPAAAVFTTSLTAAPPVQLSRRHAARGEIQAIVVNSGCANAGTGAQGMEDAESMAHATAAAVGCRPDQVLVCSTGPIGPPLPMASVEPAIGAAVAAALPDAWERAAEAIMTTDTQPKLAVRTADGTTVHGIAKGAGMVRPDMATMLAFLVTDAVADAATLRRALSAVVDRTFNSINVDGCQSTNDTVAVLATGTSGVEVADLEALLEPVAAELAEAIVRDAEGATRLVTVEVRGASDDAAALALGRHITDSDLVRSSFHRGDPNWGRIFQAVGVAGIDLDPADFAVAYDGTWIARRGGQVPYDRPALRASLGGDFTVQVVVGEGTGTARILTCDLSPEYVTFNAEPS